MLLYGLLLSVGRQPPCINVDAALTLSLRLLPPFNSTARLSVVLRVQLCVFHPWQVSEQNLVQQPLHTIVLLMVKCMPLVHAPHLLLVGLRVVSVGEC